MKQDQDSPREKLPPPLILLSTIVAAYGIHLLLPLSVVPHRLCWLLSTPLLLTSIWMALHLHGLFTKANYGYPSVENHLVSDYERFV